MICEVMMCSRILQHKQVRDTGRSFFVHRGTLAFFQSLGTVPSKREELKMSVSIGAISL